MSRLWLAAGLALMAGSASAETFTPVPGLGDTVLDFDTQSGSYSGWIIKDVSGINAVRATVQVHRLGSDPKWMPTFHLTVRDASGRHVAFVLMGLPGMAKLEVLLAEADKGKDEGLNGFQARLALDSPLEIAVDWTAEGLVTVRAGGEVKTAKLAGPATSLEFTGSTAEVELNPLRIGTITP